MFSSSHHLHNKGQVPQQDALCCLWLNLPLSCHLPLPSWNWTPNKIWLGALPPAPSPAVCTSVFLPRLCLLYLGQSSTIFLSVSFVPQESGYCLLLEAPFLSLWWGWVSVLGALSDFILITLVLHYLCSCLSPQSRQKWHLIHGWPVSQTVPGMENTQQKCLPKRWTFLRSWKLPVI